MFSVVDGGLPDSALSLEQLGSRIVALSGRLAAATCRWLLLVAEFDARDGGEYKLGFASTAQWLEYSCALAHRTAVEHVRIARSLRAWPQLAQEMGAGMMSYSQVRAISRVATGPVEESMATAELVEDLIVAAQHGSAAQLETLVRGLRTVHDNETPPLPRADREKVSQGWNANSQWALSARLDPERGEVVRSALAAVGKDGELSAADALVRLAEIGLAALADGRARPLACEEQVAIVVHVDAARIQEPGLAHDPATPAARSAERAPTPTQSDTSAEPAVGEAPVQRARSAERARLVPMGRIADGPGLPAAVVERLACIGRVRLAVRDGNQPHSDVLDLGRSRRLVTPRQCLALKIRDGDCCAHPGCRNRRGLEAHHVKHWLHGGPTDLDNLILLCEMHHRAHHHGEFAIQPLGKGRFRFWRDGRELPAWIDPSELIAEATPIEGEHEQVAATAATPRWDGTRLDHDWAITTAAQHLNLPATA
jgi:hypothetical protein